MYPMATVTDALHTDAIGAPARDANVTPIIVAKDPIVICNMSKAADGIILLTFPVNTITRVTHSTHTYALAARAIYWTPLNLLAPAPHGR